jgi:hypothetical protein
MRVSGEVYGDVQLSGKSALQVSPLSSLAYVVACLEYMQLRYTARGLESCYQYSVYLLR